MFFIIALLEERERRVLQYLFLPSWRILNIPNHLPPPLPHQPFLRPGQEQAPADASLHYLVLREKTGCRGRQELWCELLPKSHQVPGGGTHATCSCLKSPTQCWLLTSARTSHGLCVFICVVGVVVIPT